MTLLMSDKKIKTHTAVMLQFMRNDNKRRTNKSKKISSLSE
jgi:hypothetical protein